MPINKPVTYSYRPSYTPGMKHFMPTYEAYRARAEIGGTFIRAKNLGSSGNEISVEFTTDGSNVQMTVKGPVTIPLPIRSGIGSGHVTNIDFPVAPVFEHVIVTAISPLTFSVVGSVTGNLGTASVNTLFTSQHISFFIISGDVDFVTGDNFVVAIPDPTEIYNVDNNIDQNGGGGDPEGEPAPMIPSPAYDGLRAQVNTMSKFIHMPPRGWDYVDSLGTDPRTGRSVRDPSIEAADSSMIYATPKTYLFGGQGFPSSPIGIYTGTERTLVHINRGETDTGVVGEINKIYEWSGSSAKSGSFTLYA